MWSYGILTGGVYPWCSSRLHQLVGVISHSVTAFLITEDDVVHTPLGEMILLHDLHCFEGSRTCIRMQDRLLDDTPAYAS